MKRLVYIGNKLSSKGQTSTTIDTLGNNLELGGFKVIYASSFKLLFFRLLDMLWTVFKNRKTANYVLIDTYSTLNFYYAYMCSQLCRFFKLKYIPILHGGNLPNRLKNSPKLSQFIFNNAYKNIAPSEYLKSKFEAFGYSNLEVIPNVIEIKNYEFKQRSFKEIKILWVRSFSKIYNPNLAIEILSKLKVKGVDGSLCMVGPEKDGALKEAKSYADSLNIEVQFTGKLNKEEWIKLSKDYNVFINTTNFDNMPVSVIEAMALGLPVISTNVGGMPFLIEHNKNGILVESNNANLFVNVIESLIKKPSGFNKISERARKKVEQLDWQVVKHKWNDVLR